MARSICPIIDNKLYLKAILPHFIYVFLLPISHISSTCFAYPTPVDFSHSLLRWDITQNNYVVSYKVITENQSDYDEFIDIVDQAALMWSEPEQSLIELRKTDENEEKISLYLLQEIDSSPFSSGYAEFDEIDQDGTPIHCNIFVLIKPQLTYNSIAKTILHEFGHCLGLGHSLIPEAIMSYHLDQNSFFLDLDDIAAISRLYPLDNVVRTPPGCSVTLEQARNRSTLPILLIFLPLLFCLIQMQNRID